MLFLAFFAFLHFSLTLLEQKGKQLQFTGEMWNFTPTPSAPTLFRTSREISYFACSPENFCGFFSSNLPGNFALKNDGDFGDFLGGLRLPQNEAGEKVKSIAFGGS